MIQQSASDATFVAMVAARQRALRKEKERLGEQFNEDEVLQKLVIYLSEEAHSCHKKGAMVLKLKMKVLPADDEYGLNADVLDKAIKVCLEQVVARVVTCALIVTVWPNTQDDLAAGLVPTFAVATIGSTSSGSSDNLKALAPVIAKHGVWLHVDAAYAGAAFVCEEHRHYMDGMTLKLENGTEWVADSYDYNPHKVRDRRWKHTEACQNSLLTASVVPVGLCQL